MKAKVTLHLFLMGLVTSVWANVEGPVYNFNFFQQNGGVSKGAPAVQINKGSGHKATHIEQTTPNQQLVQNPESANEDMDSVTQVQSAPENAPASVQEPAPKLVKTPVQTAAPVAPPTQTPTTSVTAAKEKTAEPNFGSLSFVVSASQRSIGFGGFSPRSDNGGAFEDDYSFGADEDTDLQMGLLGLDFYVGYGFSVGPRYGYSFAERTMPDGKELFQKMKTFGIAVSKEMEFLPGINVRVQFDGLRYQGDMRVKGSLKTKYFMHQAKREVEGLLGEVGIGPTINLGPLKLGALYKYGYGEFTAKQSSLIDLNVEDYTRLNISKLKSEFTALEAFVSYKF